MPCGKTPSFQKSDVYVMNFRHESILMYTPYSQTCERDRPHLGQDSYVVRRATERNKQLRLAGIPLRSIPAGEPLRYAETRSA